VTSKSPFFVTFNTSNRLTIISNITIATFSDFSLYKQEAYGASLYAGKILAEHNVPVAYKSASGVHNHLDGHY
jgi:hypothetical protein